MSNSNNKKKLKRGALNSSQQLKPPPPQQQQQQQQVVISLIDDDDDSSSCDGSDDYNNDNRKLPPAARTTTTTATMAATAAGVNSNNNNNNNIASSSPKKRRRRRQQEQQQREVAISRTATPTLATASSSSSSSGDGGDNEYDNNDNDADDEAYARKLQRQIYLGDSDDDFVQVVEEKEPLSAPPPQQPAASAPVASAARSSSSYVRSSSRMGTNSSTSSNRSTTATTTSSAAGMAAMARLQRTAQREQQHQVDDDDDDDIIEVIDSAAVVAKKKAPPAAARAAAAATNTYSPTQEHLDEIEARNLQARLNQEDAEIVAAAEKARIDADEAMSSSVTGKALLFVQEILNLVDEMKNRSGGNNNNTSSSITAVAKDDMVYLAEATLTLQEEFRRAGKPTQVDLGIHYTQSNNLQRIRTDGLLTLADRSTRSINSNYNGSALGDGIYTANDAHLGLCYGDTGLIVARLKGIESNTRSGAAASYRGRRGAVAANYNHDTFVSAITTSTAAQGATIVLRKSSQCLALVQYHRNLIASAGETLIASYQDEIQKVVDRYFNGGRPARTTSYSSAAAASGGMGMGMAAGLNPNAFMFGGAAAAFNNIMPPPLPASLFGAAAGPNPNASMFGGGAPPINWPFLVPPPPPSQPTQPAMTFPAPPPPPPIPMPNPGPPVGPGFAFGSSSSSSGRRRRDKGAASRAQWNAAVARINAGKAAAAAGGGGVPSYATAPSAMAHRRHRQGETVHYDAPSTLLGATGGEATLFRTEKPRRCLGACVICLDDMNPGENIASMLVCAHQFHCACITRHFLHCKKCPVCRKVAGRPQGKMPSGTMTISYSPSVTCHGYGPGAVVINYSIPSAVQKSYHDNPGARHDSAHRTAYLPDNDQGRKLLKRLKYAFQHGLTFAVGTSQTTHMPNSVTWASIHHKTSPVGGAHGFPDPSFFANCNTELDNAGVPSDGDSTLG